MMSERTEKQRDALKRLGALFDQIDGKVRRPDEPSLRHVVAQHAREQIVPRDD